MEIKDLQELASSYLALVDLLVSKLPKNILPFGDFALKVAPFLLLIYTMLWLSNKIFKLEVVQFIGKHTVMFFKLLHEDAVKEPVHSGIIGELKPKYRKLSYAAIGTSNLLIGSILLVSSLIYLIMPYFANISEENNLIWSVALTLTGIIGGYFGFLQFCYGAQCIKLFKKS